MVYRLQYSSSLSIGRLMINEFFIIDKNKKDAYTHL